MTKTNKILLNCVYLLLTVVTISLFVITKVQNNVVLFSILITFFTTLFHFTIRFSVANAFYKLIEKNCSYDRWWFREKRFEKKLYRFLMIKKWKRKMPTWNDGDFSLNQNDLKTVADHMCKAEVYHEICMLLSFVPVLFSLFWGKFWVFFWTSVGGCVFDLLFVLIQRYNRPRILKMHSVHCEKIFEEKRE